MRHFKEKIVICLTVLFTATLFSSVVFAASRQEPSGDPPFGVAVQSDAAGSKLVGVIFVEHYNFDFDGIADARIVLRLRKGKVIESFYGEVSGIDTVNGSTAEEQAAITDELKAQIFAAFNFDELTQDIVVKSFEEFVTGTYAGFDEYIMADVVLAIK